MWTFITAMTIILLAAVLLFGGGKLMTLLRGFVGLFVEDMAKTPEGAAAVYNQAIEKAQNDYNQAHDMLQKAAGELDTSERELVDAQKRLKECEDRCEAFAKNNQFDKVQLFAQQRESILEEVEGAKATVAELKPLVEEAKQIANHLENKLVALKKDKNRVVTDLKRNKQVKSMYDDVNALKNTTNVDKLLDSVKNGVKESREKAVGARVVHNNSTSTQVNKAVEEAKKLQSNDYVAQLKAKHAAPTTPAPATSKK